MPSQSASRLQELPKFDRELLTKLGANAHRTSTLGRIRPGTLGEVNLVIILVGSVGVIISENFRVQDAGRRGVNDATAASLGQR